jgi:site-specific recombinase XerD
MKKISIQFNLQYKNRENSPILISVSWEGNRFQSSTGISVLSKSFDRIKGKVKSSYSRASEINQYLKTIELNITEKYYQLLTHGIPFSKEELIVIIKKKSEVGSESSDTSVDYNKMSLQGFIELFIEDKSNSKQISRRSVQKYNTLIAKLSAFQKEFKNSLEIGKINSVTLEKLVIFLSKELNNTTIEKYLRCIKVIVNFAFSKGYIQSKQTNSLISQIVKNYNINTQTIKETLTEDDLKLIEEFQPKTERLKKVKDLFLSQVYTGFRYSDLYQLRKEVIDLKTHKIKIYQEKTLDYLEANLSSKLLKILKKYSNYSLAEEDGRILSNQNYNYGIKDLCKEAGITYEVPITKFVLKTKKVEFVPKWQIISSHSARSAYITISLKRGLLPEEVMMTSGHKDRASFQRYVKISQNEALRRVHNAWE